jgi:hypothetical protein
METFLSIHQDVIVGSLTTFDRLIFKGHLMNFYPQGAFGRFLSKQNILLKDFKGYVEEQSLALKEHAMSIAEKSERPYQYLAGAMTAKKGHSQRPACRRVGVCACGSRTLHDLHGARESPSQTAGGGTAAKQVPALLLLLFG